MVNEHSAIIDFIQAASSRLFRKPVSTQTCSDDIPSLLRARKGKPLNVKELASLLACSTDYIYDQVNARTLPAAKLPGVIRFDPAVIAAWWEERCA